MILPATTTSALMAAVIPMAWWGDEIPIAAQIVAIADVYDALVSKRCYKDAYGKGQAFKMIMAGECGAFSEKILTCLAKAKEAFEALADKYAE